VKKVDPAILAGLVNELRADVRIRCERALEIALTLQMVPDLLTAIEPLLGDEDQYTRLAAVRTLGTCDLPESIAAIRGMLLDHAPLVAQAAEEALSRFAAAGPSNGPPEAEQKIDLPANRATAMTEFDHVEAEAGF
jgi:HEAT repeat protein